MLFLPLLATTVLSADMRSPLEILKLLESSKVKYTVRKDDDVVFDLRKLDVEAAVADPTWRVARRDGRTVVERIPTARCAEAPLAAAADAMEAEQHGKALAAYRTAWLCDTANPKIPTYIGNLHFMSGRLDSAVFWLRKAIAANPVDYQAHFFLSDALRSAGDTAKALDEFVEAYYLNPNGRNLRRYGDAFLDRMGMRLEDGLYRFAIGATGSPGKQATVSVGDPKQFAAAATLAAWRFDDAYAQARSVPGWESDMYVNVVANMALVWASDSATKAAPTAQQRALARLLDEQILSSAVSWEYAASVSPASICVAPPAAKANVLRYIRGYLIQSAP